MAQLAQLSAPMMRRTTGFHADHTSRQGLEECQKLRPLDLLVEDLAPGRRNAVYLENVLGQIQAHGLYCHWMAPFLAVDDNCTLARSMPVEQEPSTSSG